MSREAHDLLRRHSLFRSLAESDLGELARVARARRFSRGEVLFREAEPSEHFFSLVEGRVKVFKATPGGQDVILEIFDDDAPLGAVAVYEERPYPASAVALTDGLCIVIPSAVLLRLLVQHPSLVRGLLAGLTKRMVELTRRITELTGGHVEPRLARLFVKLMGERGQPVADGVHIPLPLSRQELADFIGTTIETTIRIMSRWGKEGLVRTEDGGFTVLDQGALHSLADA